MEPDRISYRHLFGWTLAVLAVAALVAATALLYHLRHPMPAESQVQAVVLTTLQQEAAASFLVTGTLELAATSRIQHTTYQPLLPYLPPANLGTTHAEARLPGTVAYGFDVRDLTADHIRLDADGVIHLALPPLQVFSTAPDLGHLQVASTREWRAWLTRRDGRAAERDALQAAQRALRTQAARHLTQAHEPQLHSAEALRHLLLPAVHALGVATPTFRMQMESGLVYEVRGADAGPLPALRHSRHDG
ncbi:MAG: DUF4230 domain-containing protein [Bacteroidetes bacterium]|jgi:hypothetical protein|nr:DUF4230 domain-containing protein [Bacteroidota bacterium]